MRSFLAMLCIALVGCLASARDEAAAEKPKHAQPSADPTIAELAAQLQSGTDDEQLQAAWQLGERGREAAPALTALRAALAHPRAAVRAYSAAAIGAIGPEAAESVEALVALLPDKEVVDGKPVWEYAGRALGKLGPPALAVVLSRFDPNDEAYRGASAALFEMGQGAAPALPKALEILESKETPGPAIYVLQGLGPLAAPAVPKLIELLDFETDPPEVGMHMQYWACQALRDIGPAAAPAAGKLIEKLATGTGSVRRFAAQALGGIGPAGGEQALDALALAIDDQLQPVRRDALAAVARFGTQAQRLATKIKPLCEDESKSVEAVAAGTLWHIAPAERPYAERILLERLQQIQSPWEAAEQLATLPDADRGRLVPELVKLLDDENSLTREQVAYALGLIGPVARSAEPRLKQLATSPQEPDDVRSAAREALRLIVSRERTHADHEGPQNQLRENP